MNPDRIAYPHEVRKCSAGHDDHAHVARAFLVVLHDVRRRGRAMRRTSAPLGGVACPVGFTLASEGTSGDVGCSNSAYP